MVLQIHGCVLKVGLYQCMAQDTGIMDDVSTQITRVSSPVPVDGIREAPTVHMVMLPLASRRGKKGVGDHGLWLLVVILLSRFSFQISKVRLRVRWSILNYWRFR